MEPELIRQQFISAIAPSYRLLPGSAGEGKWNSVISRQSIEALGVAIILIFAVLGALYVLAKKAVTGRRTSNA